MEFFIITNKFINNEKLNYEFYNNILMVIKQNLYSSKNSG